MSGICFMFLHFQSFCFYLTIPLPRPVVLFSTHNESMSSINMMNKSTKIYVTCQSSTILINATPFQESLSAFVTPKQSLFCKETHVASKFTYSLFFFWGVDFKLWNALNLCRFHFTSWFYCCNSRTVSEISVVPH